MTASKSKLAALGFAAAVLAGAGTGVVLNATGSAGATAVTTPDSSTDTDGTSTETPAEPGAKLQESLQGLVDSGTLTQEQLDQVITTLQENRPERGDGMGRHGHGRPGRGVALDIVAETIGISEDQVKEGLQSGQTLAEIAEANGSSAQAVIDALVAQATTRITDFVNNGPQRPADAPADDSAVEGSSLGA